MFTAQSMLYLTGICQNILYHIEPLNPLLLLRCKLYYFIMVKKEMFKKFIIYAPSSKIEYDYMHMQMTIQLLK